jgi:hypothetical protein
MWVIQATRVQLTTELSRTREKPTSLPTATKNTSSASDRKASFSAGRLFTPVPTHHEDDTDVGLARKKEGPREAGLEKIDLTKTDQAVLV